VILGDYRMGPEQRHARRPDVDDIWAALLAHNSASVDGIDAIPLPSGRQAPAANRAAVWR